MKKFSINFKELSVAKNSLRPESVPLRREDRQMLITEQLLYQINQASHWRCSIKNTVCKKPENIHRKTLALKSPLKVARREACNFI